MYIQIQSDVIILKQQPKEGNLINESIEKRLVKSVDAMLTDNMHTLSNEYVKLAMFVQMLNY